MSSNRIGAARVETVIGLVAAGYQQRTVARWAGVHHNAVWMLVRGKTWRCRRCGALRTVRKTGSVGLCAACAEAA